MSNTILRIDSSARINGSVTRELTDQVLAQIGASDVTTRDLAQGVPLIDEAWLAANFTPEAERSDAQSAALALSDELIAEINAHDTLVIGLPIYNFGVPAALKAWVDQICRAGLTFRYTETGPQGLLSGKRAIVVAASGGTEAGSAIDYATTYMRDILGFIGITEVEIVAADGLMTDAASSMAKAKGEIASIAA